MRIHEILQYKGRSVHCTTPDAHLSDVVSNLVSYNCGSLVVREGETMVGIITERDILRVMATRDEPLSELYVTDHMSSDVVTGTSNDDVETIMGLMTSHRIRHLPIMEDGQLAGIISIGDVVKAQHDRLSVENHYLKTYIQS